MNKKNIKYAILSYGNKLCTNIGDDIQSLAAIHLLKNNNIHEYVYINREKLKSYTGEPVRLIMNGWFMKNLDEFPPAKNITPLFIGFHCSREFNENIIKNIEYFKRFEPIGCRDIYTQHVFAKYNIKTYFSGCLTLAFDKVTKKNDLIYTVDCSPGEPGTAIGFSQIDIPLNLRYKDAIPIKHNHKDLNIQSRFKKANELLDLYKSAKLVLTTRLHCALPCRAFGTNVIFMHKNYGKDRRFLGLEKYINGSSENAIKSCAPSKMTIQKDLTINIRKQLNTTFTHLIT